MILVSMSITIDHDIWTRDYRAVIPNEDVPLSAEQEDAIESITRQTVLKLMEIMPQHSIYVISHCKGVTRSAQHKEYYYFNDKGPLPRSIIEKNVKKHLQLAMTELIDCIVGFK